MNADVLMLLCRCPLRQIPALGIVYTAVTSSHLMCFTMRANTLPSQLYLARVILEFVYELKPNNILKFHTPYPACGLHHSHHSGVEGYEKTN